MKILLTGASGFMGRHLAHALSAAGHTVIAGRRDAGNDPGARHIDFTRDLQARDWLPKLEGVDAVLNVVGILRESGEQTFDRIHRRAPQALFAACVAAGVRRVVHVSALGADKGRTRYFSSKRAADDYLATLPLDWTIVQPSLVFGVDGASAQLFLMLASMPVTPVPGKGEQPVQPIHIDDFSAAIVNLFEAEALRRRIPLVGSEALTLRNYLARLRGKLGLRAERFLSVPMPLMRAAATIGELSTRSPLDRETLAMLEGGNVADPAETERLLRRHPRLVDEFVDAQLQDVLLQRARLQWLLPALRFSVAAVWLWTGIVSLGLFPRESSYELLARTGVPAALAPTLLYSAAILDLLLGLATLLMHKRRALWVVQIVLILGYTLIISVKLPEFWLHPYGPLIKNLPMLVAIYLLYALEPRR
jgi:uncharacterized protein YbjT (DUF2867 family)